MFLGWEHQCWKTPKGWIQSRYTSSTGSRAAEEEAVEVARNLDGVAAVGEYIIIHPNCQKIQYKIHLQIRSRIYILMNTAIQCRIQCLRRAREEYMTNMKNTPYKIQCIL